MKKKNNVRQKVATVHEHNEDYVYKTECCHVKFKLYDQPLLNFIYCPNCTECCVVKDEWEDFKE